MSWFPLDADEWLDSETIFDMTHEQEGLFIRLLALMWRKGGYVPDSEKWVCAGLRCKPAKWKKTREYFMENSVIFERDGKLFNQELTEKLSRFNEKSQKYSENAKRRGEKNEKKTNKINDSAEPLHSDCSTIEIREEKIREEKKITPQIQESIDASRGTFFEKFVNGLVLKNTGVSIGDES